jgi:hypothetical protein
MRFLTFIDAATCRQKTRRVALDTVIDCMYAPAALSCLRR